MRHFKADGNIDICLLRKSLATAWQQIRIKSDHLQGGRYVVGVRARDGGNLD